MDEIRRRVAAIAAMPDFETADWWLTFYATGPEERLVRLATLLGPLGAVNLDGADGGFLYPKMPVAHEPENVADLIIHVRDIAEREGVEILSVDIDTSADVTRTKFAELARF
jgi:hypothetical protein